MISKPTTPKPGQPSPTTFTFPEDVRAGMRKYGHDPIKYEIELNERARAGKLDDAMRSFAATQDYYRQNTVASAYTNILSPQNETYAKVRGSQPANESFTEWDDFFNSFKNQAYGRTVQGLRDFVPAVADLTMSLAGEANDEAWYRKWKAANEQWYNEYKNFVSPEAEAAIYDPKTGDMNWRGMAGLMGNTVGFLTSSLLPFVGQAGKAAIGAKAASRLPGVISKVGGALTSPAFTGGALGFFIS